METAGVKYIILRETDDHQADIRGLPFGKGLREYRIRICPSGAESVYTRELEQTLISQAENEDSPTESSPLELFLYGALAVEVPSEVGRVVRFPPPPPFFLSTCPVAIVSVARLPLKAGDGFQHYAYVADAFAFDQLKVIEVGRPRWFTRNYTYTTFGCYN